MPKTCRKYCFLCWDPSRFSEILKKNCVVFLTLNICRKLRSSVLSSSQWIMSVVSIFRVIEEKWCRLVKWLFWGVTQKQELGVSFKNTVHNVFTITAHIEGCVLWQKSSETLINKILEKHLRKTSLFSKVAGSKKILFTTNFEGFR